MMKRKLLSLLVLLMTAVTGAWAQLTPYWQVFDNNYEHDQPLIAAIMIDGTPITAEYGGWEFLEVAAFVYEGGECISAGNFLNNKNVEVWGDPYPLLDGLDGMPIYYNYEGEPITFQMYDHAMGVEYTACTVTYLGDEISILTGEEHMEYRYDHFNPVFLNFTSSDDTPHLYLEVEPDDNTSARLMCGPVPGGCPYFDGSDWTSGDDDFKSSVTYIYVDGSCSGFTTNFHNLFKGFSALQEIEEINSLMGPYAPTDLSSMFEGCSSLTSLSFAYWPLAYLYDMSSMFKGCSSLTSLSFEEWQTDSNTNITDMFTGCTGLCYNVEAKEGDEGEYWATFYAEASGYNFQAPEGTKVFMVSLTGTTITMTEIEDRIVNSGEGVVLKSSDSNITLEPTLLMGYYDGNSLKGTTEDMDNPGGAYVLNYKAATGAGFYKLKDDKKIGANKAYLIYDDSDGARPFFSFNEETGISDATRLNDKGEMINEKCFDLQGRHVSQPTQKGLYIVNGKKYIKK